MKHKLTILAALLFAPLAALYGADLPVGKATAKKLAVQITDQPAADRFQVDHTNKRNSSP